MALMHRTMTEENLEAHRQNAQRSHGAATPEGKDRARAAHLIHGYYSELRDEALVALGESPEHLAALVEGAREQFRPTNTYQAWITDRLASLQWRIQRAERLQESKAANKIRQAEAKRRQAVEAMIEQRADVEDFLASLQSAVARPDFFTPAGCFERCEDMLEQNPGSGFEDILGLLYQLRRPRRFTAPPPPPFTEAMSDADWRKITASGEPDLDDVSDPVLQVVEGAARDPLREELWNFAADASQATEDRWQRAIAAQDGPLSARARDLLVMEMSGEMELMRREERSCVREFARLSSELKKLQKESAKPEAKSALTSRRPEANAEFAMSAPLSEAESSRSARRPELRPELRADDPLSQALDADVKALANNDDTVRTDDDETACPTADNNAKNEGSSGYVIEKTESLRKAKATEPPRSAGQTVRQPIPAPDVLTEMTARG